MKFINSCNKHLEWLTIESIFHRFQFFPPIHVNQTAASHVGRCASMINADIDNNEVVVRIWIEIPIRRTKKQPIVCI